MPSWQEFMSFRHPTSKRLKILWSKNYYCNEFLAQVKDMSSQCTYLSKILSLSDGKNLTHFSPVLAFHIETSHLVWTANQMTGFYMKCNAGVNWINHLLVGYPRVSLVMKFPSLCSRWQSYTKISWFHLPW